MERLRPRLRHHVLARILARSNFSQNHWALRLGLDKGHLSKMVRGQRPYPNAPTRQKLLEGLEVDFDELFELVRADSPTDSSRQDRRQSISGASMRHQRSAVPAGGGHLGAVVDDFRAGWKGVLRVRGLAAVTILTLALAIGANTAIFTLVKRTLLNPLPFPGADRIMTLWQSNARAGIERGPVSFANAMDWKEGSFSFEALAAVEPYSFEYLGAEEPLTFPAALVSEDFFRVWQLPALHGRVLQDEDFTPGRAAVVVLSHPLWVQNFGADPTIIGRQLTLDGGPVTVVGVMPAKFQTRLFERPRLLWAPRFSRPDDPYLRVAAYLFSVGRLREGVSPEQAQQELEPVAERLAREYPRANAGVTVSIEPFEDYFLGQFRPALMLLFAAVGLVLLIACANAANLQLTRNSSRLRSLSIRAALGAARLRLVRQLLSESLVIGSLSAALGLVLALLGIRVLSRLGSNVIPRMEEVSIDTSSLGFCIVLAVVTSLLFGLLPTLHVTGPELDSPLRSGGRTFAGNRKGRRIRCWLIVSEVALAVILLVGAGLLTRSFYRLLGEDPGFVPEGLVAMQVFAWERNRTPEARIQFFESTLQAIQSLPGVAAAGAASTVPFYGGSIEIDTTFVVSGREPIRIEEEPPLNLSVATPGFFETLRVPLLRGRLFELRDSLTSPPVVIINETLARRHFPDRDPVGQSITVRHRPFTEREIIGVVGNTKQAGLDSVPQPEAFIPHSQNGSGELTYLVRTHGPPEQALASIKEAVWSIDPRQSFYAIVKLDELIDESVASRRLNLGLLAAFGLLALVLAVIGIYGVISVLTRQRKRELGIRMVVGAQKKDILGLVLFEGVGLAAIGLLIGLAGSLALSRFLAGMLFGIEPRDPLTFVAIGLLLLGVATLASLLPARRASQIDPVQAIRDA